MTSVLSGFFTIWMVIGVGWFLAHVKVFTVENQLQMSRLSFFVGSPALLFTLLQRADLKRLFSEGLLASLIAIAVAAAVYLVLAAVIFKPSPGDKVIGTFASCYVNAGNLGIPIATFVLHDASWLAPILLVQVALLQPLGLTVLDVLAARESGSGASLARNLTLPFRNPMTIGTLLGLAANLFNVDIPAVVQQPLDLLAGLAVPTMLLAFGIALRRGPVPGKGPLLAETLTLSLIKLVLQPLVAFVMARVLGLDAAATLAVTVIAGLPTAQNVFVHSVRYDRATVLARDVIFITTIASIPTITLIAGLIGT